ncbi:MAG: membrane protein insertase YidC [Xanthomonadales bacterium]|nr:membrane protein insertase YidC [Xanthomonadales bacterium]
MTQTRTFLLLAWLMVATLLWMEWGKEQQAPVAPATPTAAPAATLPTGGVPAAAPTGAPAAQAVASASASAPLVRLCNDVLDLQLDGIQIVRAELLSYRQTREAGSPPVVLLNHDPAHAFTASSAWLASNGRAIPLQPEGSVREHVLADGATHVEAVFSGRLADGVTLRRTYRLARGSYALRVHDEVLNAGTASWTGDVERRLERVPPIVKSGMTNPEAFSLNGAAWWSPEEKYEKRKYPDFVDDGPLDQQVTGGWVGLSQHYFLGAWIPQKDQPALYSLGTRGNLHSISARGPRITLAAGQRYASDATLWVGPKLAEQLKAVAPGLDLAMDYGIFTVLSKPIHWLLTQLHKLTHNWGWAIVLLVILIKLALYPLSAAQYRSMAKMRKFQPRIEQLKERYGDDKQKFQMAMLELYKKEKINPAGGCLPILIQMPVFLALYYVLLEAVELRQAPWILGWINDLTARDPYFILPIVNGAVMWLTQKMTPMVGMDPMQKKMMQMMPLVMAVMFAFFPAGLVLYWVTNGALGMLQQWWNTKRYAEEPAKA